MNLLLCIMYLLIGIYILRNLIIKNKKNKSVGCYSGIAVGIIIYYCIVPILTLINSRDFILQYSDVETFIMKKNMWEKIFPMILVIIGFFIYHCAYNQTSKQKGTESIEYNSLKIIKISKLTGYITLIIGAISLLIFLRAFGGIKEAFSYAEILRSFSTSLSDYISGSIAILIIPARLITVAPFAFFILINERTIKHKYVYIICFIISFILSIIYFIFNAGRAPLIYFLLSFILVFIYKFIKKPWKIVFLVAIVSLPLLDILDSTSLYLQTGEWRDVDINYISYIYQFIYPFKNILNMTDIVSVYGLRFGRDFMTSIIGLIPGINFPASYENTSLFFSGTDWKTIGGTPNDLITFSYLEFGVVGIPFMFGVLGYISGKIDGIIKNMPNGAVKSMIATTMAIQIFSIIPNADFVAFVRGGGFILGFLSLIIFFSYNRRKED